MHVFLHARHTSPVASTCVCAFSTSPANDVSSFVTSANCDSSFASKPARCNGILELGIDMQRELSHPSTEHSQSEAMHTEISRTRYCGFSRALRLCCSCLLNEEKSEDIENKNTSSCHKRGFANNNANNNTSEDIANNDTSSFIANNNTPNSFIATNNTSSNQGPQYLSVGCNIRGVRVGASKQL